jgi:hypothetical protein
MGLVGNGKAATIGIFAFIILFAFLIFRCSGAHAAEIDLQGGSSFGKEGTGPVLGLNLRLPITALDRVSVNVGTNLWGLTRPVWDAGQSVPNNWDWHVALEGCRGRLCAFLGPAFLQRVDAINGAHTEYYLGLRFIVAPRWSIVLAHISDAGTTDPNIGRQMIGIAYALQASP